MNRLSLGTKYLLAAGLALLIPMLGYILVDSTLTRSMLVRDQAQSLRLAANLINGFLNACHLDRDLGERADAAGTLTVSQSSPNQSAHLQSLLLDFIRKQPDIGIILLDHGSVVLSASNPELVGTEWREEGISAVLSGETDFAWERMEHQGEPVLDVTVPWTDRHGDFLGAIHLDRSLNSVNQKIADIRNRHLVVVGIVALAVGLFLLLMTYCVVIRRLAEVNRQLIITGGNGHVKERERLSGDEIDHLEASLQSLVCDLSATAGQLERTLEEKDRLLEQVGSFNVSLSREVDRARCELLEVQSELMRAEQMSTMGKLAAGLAHELRNPLFIIRASAEAIDRKFPDSTPITVDIVEEVDRLNNTISRLVDLARPMHLDNRQEVPLQPLLQEVVYTVRKALPENNCPEITLETNPEDPLVLQGDYHYLRQALTNIVMNACEAQSGPDGSVSVRAKQKRDTIKIKVQDWGEGIAEEDLPNLFEPFFTRKPAGTGLGLCATQKILDLHGATIKVKSKAGEGTTFTVKIPVSS